jgi:hypothetical protein
MTRSYRFVSLLVFAAALMSARIAFAPPSIGPELDPSSLGVGLALLTGGSMYLVERYRRR